MLEVSKLASRYGRIPALAEVSLRVGDGELVAIVGANGAGKTTLLKTLSGVQPASSGSVRFEGAEIAGEPPRQRVKRGIVQVPEGRQVFGALSVEDNLALGAYARGDQATAETVWAMFPVLRDKRRDPAGTLSGGQQQMLAISRALMLRPTLLLLDEPSFGVAPLVVAEIFRILRQINQEDGVSMLLVEQNANLALDLADHAYLAGDDYTIADIAVWPWYGTLAKGQLYAAGEFLQVQDYKHVQRWTDQLATRPAVKRGRMVNRTWGAPASQLHERAASRAPPATQSGWATTLQCLLFSAWTKPRTMAKAMNEAAAPIAVCRIMRSLTWPWARLSSMTSMTTVGADAIVTAAVAAAQTGARPTTR